MSTIDDVRTTIDTHYQALLHPATSEESENALAAVRAATVDPDAFIWAATWAIGAGSHALKVTRERHPTPEQIKHSIFAPMTTHPVTGEPLSPLQIAVMRMVTAGANSDLDMLEALLAPYHDDESEAAASRSQLLGDLLFVARALHQTICGGGD